ncbi:UNVERIFIED_CONTAM: phosphoesterase [Euhalothece sp. KZN 001]
MSAGASGASTATYAILGCGSVGYAVVEELVDAEKDVLIIDHDPGRVESLRDQDLNATEADISDAEIGELLTDREVIVIMSSDIEANRAALETVRSDDVSRFVVVRASDPVSADEFADLGADVVINPAEVIADSALRQLESGELEYKATQLRELIDATDGEVAIITQDNPDPDSIASAVALQAIVEAAGAEAVILYGGEIGQQENRAFVNLLGIDLEHFEESPNLEAYDLLALVDHIPSGEVVDLDQIDILIDHDEHPETVEATFADVRPNISSTSTILTKYLQEFDLTPTEVIATALLYGIRSETVDFKRETTPADLTAAAYLYPFADHDTLEQVESPSMSPETLDILAEAIQNREVQGSHLISNAGFIRNQDALGEAAQHLLKLEGITTTAVFGIADDRIFLAARSKDIRVNIGSVLEDAFSDIGTPSGHSTQGDVEIPLGIFGGASDTNRETLLTLTEESVSRALFRELGVEGTDAPNGS